MVAQNLRKEKTKSAILASARICFGKAGYANTTIDIIAESANVTKGAVYHHFSSKAQIFDQVHELLSIELSKSVMEVLQSHAHFFDTVRTALEVFFLEFHDDKIVRIIFQDGPAVLGIKRWREIDHENFAGQIRGVLAMGMEAELIQTHPLDPLANLFSSAVNESILQCASAENFSEASAKYIDAIMLLLSGISTLHA